MNRQLTAHVLVGGLLTVGILCGSGCVLNVQEERGSSIVSEGRIGFVLTSWNTDLSTTQRFVPVHPDDGGSGGVTVDLDGRSAPVKAGVNVGVRGQRLRVYVGSDFRFNNLTLGGIYRYVHRDDEEKLEDEIDDQTAVGSAGIIDVVRQPVLAESYGYGRLLPGNTTWIPYVGLEIEINRHLRLALEGGLPRSKFVYEKGHYRYDETQAISRDSSTSFGWRGGIRLTYAVDDGDGLRALALEYHREHYDAEFVGDDTDIDAGIFSLTIGVGF